MFSLDSLQGVNLLKKKSKDKNQKSNEQELRADYTRFTDTQTTHNTHKSPKQKREKKSNLVSSISTLRHFQIALYNQAIYFNSSTSFCLNVTPLSD